MTDTILAPTTGTAVAPVDPATLNNGEGDGFDAPATPVADAPAQPGSIADASKALRETPADPAPVAEQPRNPDGTFAPKAPAEGDAEPVAGAEPAVPDAPADPVTDPVEPKLFVLKGEAQRGETDLELDATDLPPEVVDRLDRLQKQGMRRAEFDHEMRKVRADRSNLDAVETEMAVDTEGFLLNRVAPAKRRAVAEALLLDQFEALAPMIEQLWNDPAARYAKLDELRRSVESRRGEVVSSVTAARHAADVRSAVSDLIPDTANEGEAQEFFATSIALLQQRAMQNQSVTSTEVPAILAAHRRRFFGASEPAAPTPPARPKLAVRQTPTIEAAPVVTASSTTVLSQEDVARRAKARTAALATAKPGAGVGAVQRDVGPANETIQERSKRLRAAG